MPTATDSPAKPLRVAIVGGGPGGLGAAIALSALPDVEVNIYEQARELREVGAGIRIGFNCWKVLELLGAADGVKGHVKTEVFHRNGLTGELLKATEKPSLPYKYLPRRVQRTRLQSALVSKVPKGVIHLGKRLSGLVDMGDGTVRLEFEDGTDTVVDLVVGADGIRSVVRDAIFPDHAIKFTGTTIWRCLIPVSSVSHIPDVGTTTTWWHGRAGHVYTSPVDDPSEAKESEPLFEISCRNLIDPATATWKRFSWGVPATNERVESHFTDYDPRVREALAQVPQGQWKEFSAFAGPRLNTVTGWEKVVLVGDASHPLSGAFGSGAAFALEDGWILARAIELIRREGGSLADALDIFDRIRSPYYLRMYEHLDGRQKSVEDEKAANPHYGFEDGLRAKVNTLQSGGLSWIYDNNIEEVWKTYTDGRGVVENDQKGIL